MKINGKPIDIIISRAILKLAQQDDRDAYAWGLTVWENRPSIYYLWETELRRMQGV